jgi:anti-sigma regulatory factor (Ser/Thr protein kinase)
VYRVQVFWLAYFAMLPGVFLLADRYRLDLHRWQSVAVHVLGALAFVYIHIVVVAIVPGFKPRPSVGLQARIFRLVQMNFAVDFLSYWFIVGSTYAFQYYSELRRRDLVAAQLEASLAQSRLQALQAKLNPHFFFNTLQIISVLALKRDYEGVIDTLGRLSELLRVSFDDTRPQLIPLASELEFLDQYVAIQRLSFGSRLTVDRYVAADALNALVPTMILQPLVENALVHGVAKQPGDGSIVIEAACVDQRLRLCVQDSGPGFDSRSDRPTSARIGLANTEARLKQIYGDHHQIEYGRSSRGGACVTIVVPLQTATSHAAA